MKYFYKANSRNIKLIFLISFLTLGLFLRVINYNYEDLWFDEMASFWSANPDYNFIQTLNRIFEGQLMLTYEVFLKYFFKLTFYNQESGRLFSLIIGLVSLFYFSYFSYKIGGINLALIATILLSINLFHIKYSQELRCYILYFLLILINCNILLISKNFFKKNYRYFFFFLIIIITFYAHPLSIVFYMSYIFFVFFDFFVNRAKITNEHLINLSIIFITLLLCLLVYFNNITHTAYWVKDLKISFLTNYFSSNFFGSRFLGLIHLFFLIFSIIYNFKNIKSEKKIIIFLINLFFITYFFIVFYSLLVSPIAVPRYFIYVLIPYLILISNFILKVKSRFLKYSFFLIFLITSLLNHAIYENTFKQIYTKPFKTKPDFKSALSFIKENQNSEFYTLKYSNHINKVNIDIQKNYTNYLIDKGEYKLTYINTLDNQTLPKTFWVFCLPDVNLANCELLTYLKKRNYIIIKNKDFNRLNVKLIEKY